MNCLSFFEFLLELKYFPHSTKTKKDQIYSNKCHEKQLIFNFSNLVAVQNPIKTREKYYRY